MKTDCFGRLDESGGREGEGGGGEGGGEIKRVPGTNMNDPVISQPSVIFNNAPGVGGRGDSLSHLGKAYKYLTLKQKDDAQYISGFKASSNNIGIVSKITMSA